MTCLQACGNDVDEAKKLYDFLAGDMPNLPDVDPIEPTKLQQARDAIGSLFGWLKENRGEIIEAWDFVNAIRGGASATTATTPIGVPPIPD